MGEAETISADNERRVLIMLQSMCTQVVQHAREKISALEVRHTTRYLFLHRGFMREICTAQILKGDCELHPFALLFVSQIWKETLEIAQQTLLDIDEKLLEIQ